MYHFVNFLRSKSKLAEDSFMHVLNQSNNNYCSTLLFQSYELKKLAVKLLNMRGKKIPFNSKKFDYLRRDYGYSCGQFNLILMHVHLFFTIALNFRLFKKYDFDSLSFGQILMHDSFKLLYDSHEQLILRRFNVVRNIFAHSAPVDLFLLLSEDDYIDLFSLINSLISLESELMDYLRKNSFFETKNTFYDIVNGDLSCVDDNFSFISSLLFKFSRS